MKDGSGDRATRKRKQKSLARVSAAKSPGRPIPLITLLTDFGTTDYFVAAVKGVILTANPAARIVDITHEIPSHDIEAAAFTLLAAFASFPPGTIHVGVVDPGVGSARRGLLIEAHEQYFIGPDNGIFSYVCDSGEPRIFHLNNPKYFRQPVSSTFNGRDVFAPVAAALSLGVRPEDLGTRIGDPVRLRALGAELKRDGTVHGRIINIDRFGNCVTNLTPKEVTPQTLAKGARLRVQGRLIQSFRTHFTAESKDRSQLFAIWGSAGFLEIAAEEKSAAKILKAARGDSVIVERL